MYPDLRSVPLRVASVVVILMLLFGAAALLAHADASVELKDVSSPSSAGVPEDAYRLPPGYGDPFYLAEQRDRPVSSGTSTIPGGSGEKRREVPSIGSYGKAFFPDLVDGTKRIFSPDIGTVALIGLGVTGLSFAFDRTVDDYFQKHQPLHANTGDKIGQGYVPIGLGVALFATGEVIDNKQLADAGSVSLEALAVTGIATEALKYVTRRQRPNHVDNMSFPSGHASMTAAFAASVSEMYDWNLWLAVPLYATTAFVGASRIQAGEHHFSDVVAGITLGTVVGMGMGRNRKEKNLAGSSSISVAPCLDGPYKGVVFNWRF